MAEVQRVFTVDGKPFLSIGGQARNSSGYNAAEAETAFQAVKLLHGNTLEIPVYWEQVEPEEGRFDFSSVGELLSSARRHGVKLVLLWFATWKNGDMDYAPAWVKTDSARFKRVMAPTGVPLWVLSSHCEATWEADHRAFVALCQYLKEHDAEGSVIALQIENEPGILGSDRDYGPEAQATFERSVPRNLVAALRAREKSPVAAIWREAGAREEGSWPELFGDAAGEIMTAWSIATYIDRLAEAGKAILDIPMYLNVWLGEIGWRIAGQDYPSGGAVGKVLDVYKAVAPHIDLIAPDIYIADAKGYEATCARYARDDNPLFVPESAPWGSNAWLMFRALADYDAIGYHIFGVESVIAEDGSVRPEARMMVDSFRCVAAAIPLLLAYQGTGRIHAVVQEEGLGGMTLDLDGYIGLVEFGEGPMRWAAKDWRHPPSRAPRPVAESPQRARGLIVQADRHTFYLVGADYRLHLRPKVAPEVARDAAYSNPPIMHSLSPYISVDEGHLDADGAFHIDRRRNGDETNHGTWVEPDTGVVRIVMCP